MVGKMYQLLQEKKVVIPPHPFATDWQAVIFRNYGTVKTENLAKVLTTTVEVIDREAERLGLYGISYEPKWKEKGYITIIKNNWYLLDYDGICTLVEMTKEQLGKTLWEDDFLFAKLGNFKPIVTSPRYKPLTENEKEKTEKQAEIVKKCRPKECFRYFDFFKYAPDIKNIVCNKSSNKALRMVYNYGELFGDNLLTGDFSAYSDEMLKKLSGLGINAIWKHIVLYDLVGCPFEARYGKGNEIRLKNLAALCDKLEKYGIKLWLYLNEPRALPIEFFNDKKHLLGVHDKTMGALCTSVQEVKDFLYNGVKKLVQTVPKLGGLFSITSSENLTNCFSRMEYDVCECPRCKSRTREEVCLEINELYQKALKDADSDVKLIAWTWGWNKDFHWTDESVLETVKKLSKDTAVMCVSEENLSVFVENGESIDLLDYSISQVGPSERSAKIFQCAKEIGHPIIAKIQVNNSWECASVPYIPCFELVWKHLQRLNALSVDGYMLSWSLGGYPSFNLSLVAHFDNGRGLDEWYKDIFEKDWKNVKNASELFSAAFEHFPFSVPLLYNGPQHVGCGNTFYEKSTGLKSTMVGFPFDDLEFWRGKFSKEAFLVRLKKLTDGWREGLRFLDCVQTYNARSVKRIAETTYRQFYSAYLMTEWIIAHNKETLKAEYENVKEMLVLAATDSSIGFEACNHYFFNENTLLEKCLSLEKMLANE